MDMFSPTANEMFFKPVPESSVPASGALADDGESRAQCELAALGDRVFAARLVV